MVDDDDIEPVRHRRLERRVRRGAAVDGDHHRRALGAECAQRLDVGTVALGLAVRDVDRHRAPEGGEKTHQQRRRGGAVDVVIAQHADGLALAYRLDQPFHRPVHVAEVRRIGQRCAQGRVEERLGIGGPDAPRRQHAADDLGQFQLLGDGDGGAIVAAARAPALAGDGPLDAENRAVGNIECGRHGDHSSSGANPVLRLKL